MKLLFSKLRCLLLPPFVRLEKLERESHGCRESGRIVATYYSYSLYYRLAWMLSRAFVRSIRFSSHYRFEYQVSRLDTSPPRYILGRAFSMASTGHHSRPIGKKLVVACDGTFDQPSGDNLLTACRNVGGEI